MTESTYSAHGADSPEALEREVDAERSRVAETLDALQDKMSVGNIVDDVVRSFSRYGGDMAGNLGRQVRQNPLPLLLTGVGLVWLMTSSGRDRTRSYRDEDYLWEADDDDLYEEDFVGTRHYGTSGAARPYGTADVGGTYRDNGGGSTGSRLSGAAGSAAHGVSHAAGSAASGAGSAARSAGHAAGSAASSVGSVASSAARGISRAVGAVASGVGSAASALSSGGRGAYQGVRHSGGSVRDGAYHAYDAGRSSIRRLDEMVHDHPLVMGALALAVGAAIGGALPRTRTEDEYIGEYSDHAKEAARETVQREAEKARRVAGAVADEAREIYTEKSEEVDRRLRDAAEEGRSAADRAKSEVAGAAERLRDAGMTEAERQNLGDPKKPA